jgi:pimeloyl-ACP methyl ester carboxylesterase
MINVRFYGKEPFQVAVIHGGPGAPGTVAAIARELSKEYGVMEPIQTKTSLEGQVFELCEVVRNFGELPMTLIGHSWGAWLAYIFAARYPSLVKKLILIGSGPFKIEYVKDLEENRLGRLSVEEKEEFNYLINSLNSSSTNEKDRDLARLGKFVSKTDNYHAIEIETDKQDTIQVQSDIFQAVWSEASKLRQTGYLLELGRKINCPVVAIHGDYNPHPAEGVKIPLEQVLNDFRFYLLKKCGHSPWKEKYAKDAFYQLILEVIKGI